MREAEVMARLRRMATAPEARGLLDDVAVLDGLVITHDSIAEGIHFLSSDPPASVGWNSFQVGSIRLDGLPIQLDGLEELVEDLSIERLPEAGHFAPWEAGAEVAALLEPFLAADADATAPAA